MSLKPWCLAVCLFAAALSAAAQSNLAQLAPQADVLSLQTWRIHSGDELRWASPAFDDSQWQSVSYPIQQSLADHTSSFRWYRTSVVLPPSLQGRDLAIGMGPFDEVWEVYVEGILVGRFGHWTPQPESSFNRNLTLPIPAGTVKAPVVHIAIRRWTGETGTGLFPFYSSGVARFAHPPELGTTAAISARTSFYISSGIVHNIPWNLCLLAMFVAGCIVLVLYSAQRSRVEYLLLAVYCFATFLDPLIGALVAANDSVMRRSWGPVLVFVGYMLAEVSAIIFLAALCRRFQRILLLGSAIALLLGIAGIYGFYFQSPYGQTIAVQYLSILVIALDLLAAWGLFLERKPGSVAIAAALVVVEVATAWTNNLSHALHMSDLRFMTVGPVFIDLRSVVQTLFVFVTLVVLYLRYRQDQFRQVALEQDMASARRMQEQLLGGNLLSTPGFDLEAVYLPAHEVGGDFYRTVHLKDGSLLVIVGDVSGKGLDAAMLVAAVLGGLANETERRPGSLLDYLNHAVMGRTGGGFITACAARFSPDGRVVVANAGHIAPYLDGREMELESGLPLGVSLQASYAETEMQMGGRVTFTSDGVVEARDAKGELLGFDRVAGLMSHAAAEIAQAAQQWGQEDDITVLTVRSIIACA
jgi:sigma-B regulation protein RsbU (phosphoserine phosphatase)